MEDDRIAVLEAQLAQAKQIADEADRKYEEVKHLRRIPAKRTDSESLSLFFRRPPLPTWQTFLNGLRFKNVLSLISRKASSFSVSFNLFSVEKNAAVLKIFSNDAVYFAEIKYRGVIRARQSQNGALTVHSSTFFKASCT